MSETGYLERGASQAVEQRNEERIRKVPRDVCETVGSCYLVLGDSRESVSTFVCRQFPSRG